MSDPADEPGRQPRRPFHVEAYPRLDLRLARNAVRVGRGCVIWRDQGGALVGIARVTLGPDERMRVDARFRGLFYVPADKSELSIALEVRRPPEGGEDVLTTCVGCGISRRALVYAHARWLCRSCHDLVYRSTIVTKAVRDAERLAELDRYLANGRPRYLRHDLFKQVRVERFWLRKMQDGPPVVAPPHQRLMLSATWLAEPAPLVVVDDGPPGGQPGGQVDDADVLELVGEPLFAGEPLKAQVERAIRDQVAPVYRALRAASSPPSALRVRRGLPAAVTGELPVLGAPAATVIVNAAAALLEARLVVPFAGDAALFAAGLPELASTDLPTGTIVDQQLLLAVRLSRANAPLVAPLLQAELDRVRMCLAAQGSAIQAVHAGGAALIKRIVADKWPTLGRRKPRG